MNYPKLINIYLELEKTTKRLEKTEILAKFLKKIPKEDVKEVIYLLQGKVFPQWDERKIGISNRLIIKVIASSTGNSPIKVEDLWKTKGDLGKVAEVLIEKRKQTTLARKKLTIKKVFENIRRLPEFEGKGAVEKKTGLISELLTSAKPSEARFIVSTILEQLRLGVASGLIRDAIAQAFNVDVKEVENAYNLTSDYGETALIAKTKGNKGLTSIKLKPGKPLKTMLALLVNNVGEAFEALGKPAQIENKLDGFRLQIHKDKEIKLFTRRMEDVTKQFPDVVEIAKKYIKGDNYIIDCEAVGYDKKTGKHMPFQNISQRIKRKYDIEKIADSLPVEINVFDLIYYNNKNLMQEILEKRRKLLEKIIKNIKKKIVLTKKIVTSDEKKAEEFFGKALKAGEEGVMIKNINSNYRPGRYVNGWVKLKGVLEPLDLVIIGATYGQGKRAGWLTSYNIACKSGDKLLGIGKVGTGIKEKAEGVKFKQMTDLLIPLIISKKGNEIVVKPKIIVEVGYEEIQKSIKYSSGYALRFPKIKMLRSDKPLGEISNLELVKKIYNSQRGKK